MRSKEVVRAPFGRILAEGDLKSLEEVLRQEKSDMKRHILVEVLRRVPDKMVADLSESTYCRMKDWLYKPEVVEVIQRYVPEYDPWRRTDSFLAKAYA